MHLAPSCWSVALAACRRLARRLLQLEEPRGKLHADDRRHHAAVGQHQRRHRLQRRPDRHREPVRRRQGGTLTFVDRSDLDSPDPGNTYAASPGSFVPLLRSSDDDLRAASRAPRAPRSCRTWPRPRASSSDNGLTWTYKIKPGVKFQDGSVVTSADVKYAIERSNWGQDTLKNGPNVLHPVRPGRHEVPGPVQGQGPEPRRVRHRDPGRQHHRLPPDDAVRGLRLPDGDLGLGPGAAREGHRRGLLQDRSCPPASTRSTSYQPGAR